MVSVVVYSLALQDNGSHHSEDEVPRHPFFGTTEKHNPKQEKTTADRGNKVSHENSELILKIKKKF